MVLGIQVAALLFGLFMVYYSFLRLKRKEFTKKEFMFWMVVWVLFIIATSAPDVLEPFFRKLSFARKLDVYIISGFMFLIGIAFYTYTLTRKNQRQIDEIVRKIAFEKK